MDSRSINGSEIYEEAKTEVKDHWPAWTSLGVGTGFQFAEHSPELIEDNVPLVESVPRALFENYINNYNGDKLVHAAFSYGCAHQIIRGLNAAGLEDNYITKMSAVYGLTLAGGWIVKEQMMDNYADPEDMVANLAGSSAALLEDYYQRDMSTESYESNEENFHYNIDEDVAEALSTLNLDQEEVPETKYPKNDD